VYASSGGLHARARLSVIVVLLDILLTYFVIGLIEIIRYCSLFYISILVVLFRSLYPLCSYSHERG
jgi:hypothetical protein